jgi:hypothetical protein
MVAKTPPQKPPFSALLGSRHNLIAWSNQGVVWRAKGPRASPATDAASTPRRRLVGDLAVRSAVGRKGDWRGSVTHTVKHINLHGSQAPASRAAAFASHLDKLRDKAFKGGGDKRIDAQHGKGKLTARERLEVIETPPLFVLFSPNWFATCQLARGYPLFIRGRLVNHRFLPRSSCAMPAAPAALPPLLRNRPLPAPHRHIPGSLSSPSTSGTDEHPSSRRFSLTKAPSSSTISSWSTGASTLGWKSSTSRETLW